MGIGESAEVRTPTSIGGGRVRTRVRELGQKNGIATLILDWSDDDLPPLAVALAMAESTVSAFLKRHVTASALAFKSVTALKTIRESNGYKSHATRIRALLREPTTGAGLAKHANTLGS